ncbi:hypothetical protein ARMGADRAFT_974278 [Armillaria gallica]|uniref:Uncharacterized protein n=1 Tax=Armillaria gallica TaxID=47427 RepID=A0A2H3CZ19_ARMGA|nr:hypothetical protein ARMGADRAFT_974278 [Armillaria gallica]
MSAGMTGSDLEDAVRTMPPIPKTPQVQPTKKRVSQQQARSPIHTQDTVPKPYMCKTEAAEHQFNYSTLPMNSRGEGHFFSAAASFETEYMVHFEIPTNGYFDNQSPLSEINYCLAMSSGFTVTRENSTYDSSCSPFNSPDTSYTHALSFSTLI